MWITQTLVICADSQVHKFLKMLHFVPNDQKLRTAAPIGTHKCGRINEQQIQNIA